MKDEDRLITVPEAMRLLSVSRPTINAMMNDGRLIAVDLNRDPGKRNRYRQRLMRIPMSQIRRYVGGEDNEVGNESKRKRKT